MQDAILAHWRDRSAKRFSVERGPRYLVRDRDSAFYAWTTTAAVIGVEEILTAPRSPWQSADAKRLVGSIRRECLDHIIVANVQAAGEWSVTRRARHGGARARGSAARTRAGHVAVGTTKKSAAAICWR